MPVLFRSLIFSGGPLYPPELAHQRLSPSLVSSSEYIRFSSSNALSKKCLAMNSALAHTGQQASTNSETRVPPLTAQRICLEATTVEVENPDPSVGEHRRMVPV